MEPEPGQPHGICMSHGAGNREISEKGAGVVWCRLVSFGGEEAEGCTNQICTEVGETGGGEGMAEGVAVRGNGLVD